MSRSARLAPAPALLLALVACGGGGSSSSSASTFTASSTASFTEAVINDESLQGSATALPAWAPDPEAQGAVARMAVNTTPPSACITASPITVDSQGVSHLTWTYTNCQGPEGGTINGTRAISFAQDPANANAVDYTIVPDLTITNGTRTWRIQGGTRTLVVDAATKTTAITVRSMTATLTDSSDPSFNATYTWSRDMVADWSLAGVYKLWGTFTFQNSDSTRGPVTGSISSGDPLVWETGCCHPQSGTVNLTRVTTGATATATFALPCGTLNLAFGNGRTATRTLLCPQ